MNSIKELAYKMFSDSQRMYVNNKEPHSFFNGYREVMFNGKIVKYEATMMRLLGMWDMYFSKTEWHELGAELHRLITPKNNDWFRRFLLEKYCERLVCGGDLLIVRRTGSKGRNYIKRRAKSPPVF